MSRLRFDFITLEEGKSRISSEDFQRQMLDHEQGRSKRKPVSFKGRNGKFNAVAVTTDEGRFDSKMEYRRYLDLTMMQRAGAISDLRRQVKYPLILEGVLVCTYIADFVYTQDGQEVVEDSKGYRTPEFRQKKRLMKEVLGIDILETGTGKSGAKRARRPR